MVNIQYGSSGSQYLYFNLLRGGTSIGIGDTAGSRLRVSSSGSAANTSAVTTAGLTFIDSPSTTSATTYKMQMSTTSGTSHVNRSNTDSDSTTYGRPISTITLMEIGA